MNTKIRIVIADNHKSFTEGLIALLNTDITEVTDVVNNITQLNPLTYASYLNLILLDIDLPGANGFGIVTTIKSRRPQIKIIILATHTEEHFVLKARQHGADGYLLKNTNRAELLLAISLVYNGTPYFPKLQQPAQCHTQIDRNTILANYNLTRREKELLPFIKESHTVHEIAASLNVSVYTIKSHRKNILQKLQLKNTIELKKFIVKHNL